MNKVKEQECLCLLHARYLDPEIFLRIVNHPLRKKILHMLSLLTLEKPIAKKELAGVLGIPYTRLLFQLNKQLNGFWKIERERKKRGAHEELIAPVERNSVYVMLGSDATLYVLDPLANIFGKLSQGTRCRECSSDQLKKCLAVIDAHICFGFSPEDRKRQEKLLLANGRSPPFTPMDYILACAALRSLEGRPCAVRIADEDCQFMSRIRHMLSEIGMKASS